jgi:hypothetical protein
MPVQIGDLTVNVPSGSMDHPTPELDAKVKELQDATNWKMPTKYVVVATKDEADDLINALIWYMGGAEIEKVFGVYRVGSKGYYYYVGS